MSEGKYELLPIVDIGLDRSNPRIQRVMAMYADPTDDDIGLALGAAGDDGNEGGSGTTYHSLKASIKTNGGLIQPIIVNRTKAGLRVIEGNTRLFIYKKFNEDGAEGDWAKIPAVVHDNLEGPEIDKIRLQAHLVGPRAWDPYSKAKYLHLLNIEQNMPMSFLVDYCGGRKQEVERYIQAYEDMEKFYRPLVGDDFDPTRFSAFVEVQKPSVRNVLISHGLSQADFSKWIMDGKFNRLEHVRQLPRIFEDEDARKKFLTEGSRAAINLLESRSGTTNLDDASFEDLASALAQRIRALNWSEVVEMRGNPEETKRLALMDVSSEVQMLVDQVEDNG